MHQVRGSVKCDLGSTVAGASHLVTGASSTTLDGSVRFLGKFFITTGAFALGQVLNFASLAYGTNSYGELRPLDRATSTSNELPASSPPPGLMGADLKVLAQQIWHGLGLSPTVSDQR